ncbi:MAG: aminoacyl--tRNA ligase-related protein [Burkholderiales bacterium]
MAAPDPDATGLATLDHDQIRAIRRFDQIVLGRADARGCRETAYPALTPVADLERIDYFRNFPHLGLGVAAIDPACVASVPLETEGDVRRVPADALQCAHHFLPSAACYPVYSTLRDRQLRTAHRVCVLQRCFRNETHYEGLVRLRGFTMRELVVVGTRDDVLDFVGTEKRWIGRLALALGLDLEVRAASDPFFDPGGTRAKMQQLFPVKEEFVFEGDVAVSSVNSHRNFFGERWNIRVADGTCAFSGCVAFGLERWLHALTRRHAGDYEAIQAALASPAVAAALTEPLPVPGTAH